jgi:hypothetical protein
MQSVVAMARPKVDCKSQLFGDLCFIDVSIVIGHRMCGRAFLELPNIGDTYTVKSSQCGVWLRDTHGTELSVLHDRFGCTVWTTRNDLYFTASEVLGILQSMRVACGAHASISAALNQAIAWVARI